MKKLICLQVLLFLLCLPIAAKSQTNKSAASSDVKYWVGEYKHTYTEGKTEGGDVPVIEYLLVVSEKAGSLVAHFTVDGYQAYDDYLYTAKANGSQLNLYFLKDLRNSDMERTGGKRLRKGQMVGTLVKITVRGKARYQYKNGAYEISFGPKNPVYFKKTK